MTLLAFAGICFSGCDKDDDGIKVDQKVETAFNVKYPGASRVSWERKSGYLVASFTQDNTRTEGWFDADGQWYMTESDIPFSSLPQTVKTAFGTSQYKDGRVDDVDKIERLGAEIVYVIEVDAPGGDVDLYYSSDGILIKVIFDDRDDDAGDHVPGKLPAKVTEFISMTYPSARILDVDVEMKSIEVDIIDGTTPRELMFTTDGTWVYTKTDVRRADVLPAVITALEASQYAAYAIEDIEYFQTPSGDYYEFELESGNTEADIRITDAGVITVIP